VEMRVNVDRSPESLDEAHRPAAPLYDAELVPGTAPQGSEYGAQEDRQHRTAEFVVIRQAVAKGDRKREHPLAHGSFGKDAIHKMGRGIGHPPARARRTESAAFTRKRDEPIIAAGLAAHAEKAPAEKAAVEEGLELALDEAGDHPTLFLGAGEKGFEVLLYDAVEHAGFGRAPLVLERVGHAVRSEGVVGHGWEPMRGACLGWQGPCGRERAPERSGVSVGSRPRRDGFSLHADVCVPARDRRRLERLARYCARPPIATHRLSEAPDGLIVYRLRLRWRDGTTHVVFDPLDLVARLAALVPPPPANLVRYFGILAPCASWRDVVVQHRDELSSAAPPVPSCPCRSSPPPGRAPGRRAPTADGETSPPGGRPTPASSEQGAPGAASPPYQGPAPTGSAPPAKTHLGAAPAARVRCGRIPV